MAKEHGSENGSVWKRQNGHFGHQVYFQMHQECTIFKIHNHKNSKNQGDKAKIASV